MNIDRKIAKLMGWHLEIFPEEHWADNAGVPFYLVYDTTKESSLSIWHPSTDIGQAMGEVVEKMREKGYHFQLNVHAQNKLFNSAIFFDRTDESLCFKGFDPAPAMAICKAALKAIEA